MGEDMSGDTSEEMGTKADTKTGKETGEEPITIELATAVDGELVAAWTRLSPQLSSAAPKVTTAQLQEVISGDCSSLLVARTGQRVVGTLTLIVFSTPTGRRARIEDVVVDQASRGRGIGEALVRAAVSSAGEQQAATLDLASHPARKAANRLYRRTGFALLETNAYRHVPTGHSRR